MTDDDRNETLAMIARCDRHQWPFYYSTDAPPLPPLVPEFDKTKKNAETYFSDVT